MDDYEIISKLGSGSYGQALLAKKKGAKENCVIKEIKVSHLNVKDLESAKKEVKVLSSLLHSHITKFHDSFESCDSLYIVMEYCGGGDLQQLIDSRDGVLFPETRILDWFVQLCLAVRFIHQRHIIHRDIKTQNVFLTNEGRVKLGDFGIAKILDKTSDLANTCIGTPYYLSPEMCENKPYSNKSDIWAVGCVLYEMAALKHAFNACNMKALVIKIIKCAYQPLPHRYSRDLKHLIQQIFQRYPKCRPSISSILTKTFISKRLSRFVNDSEAEELRPMKAVTPKNISLASKRNLLRSRIGISSPAAKYIITPKINVGYPSITVSSNPVPLQKVQQVLQTNTFLDTYKNSLNTAVNKTTCSNSHYQSSQSPHFIGSRHKIEQLSEKKKSSSYSSKYIAKSQNNLVPSIKNKPYQLDESSKCNSKSDRQSKLNLIIKESSDSFKKIDVSNSILSNLNKLEYPLYGTDLQNSSGWLVDLYLSKKLTNLKNDLKSSEHLCDSMETSNLHLSEILSDIQQQKYSVPIAHNKVSRSRPRPLSYDNVHNKVNFIVEEEVKKVCDMAQNRRKIAYDEEKCVLETTFKSSSSYSNSKNLAWIDSESKSDNNIYWSESKNHTEICQNLTNYSYKCSKDDSFLAYEYDAQQNRKHWSNGPSDIVSILSSAKLLDGRNSMDTIGKQSLTRSDVRIGEPISFSDLNNEHCNSQKLNYTSSSNCVSDVKKMAMDKTYNISTISNVSKLKSSEEISKSGCPVPEIILDIGKIEITPIRQTSIIDDQIQREIETHLHEIEIDVSKTIPITGNGIYSNAIKTTSDDFEVVSSKNIVAFNKVNCESMEPAVSPMSNSENNFSFEEYRPLLKKRDLKKEGDELGGKNENISLFLPVEEDQHILKENFFSSSVPKSEPTLTKRKRFFSFLHSKSNAQPFDNLPKITSPKKDATELSTPKSKARFSAILKKFLQRESQAKSTTCKLVKNNVSNTESSEELLHANCLPLEASQKYKSSLSEKNEIVFSTGKDLVINDTIQSNYSLVLQNENDAVEETHNWRDVRMNVTKDSGVESSNTNSSLDNGTTDRGSLVNFISSNSNNLALQPNDSIADEQISDAYDDADASCSTIPIDVKYISGLEIKLSDNSIANTTIKENSATNLDSCNDKQCNSIVNIAKNSFDNAFKTVDKYHNSLVNNIDIVMNGSCSKTMLDDESSLRKTAFILVENAFTSAIRKLEEKNLFLTDSFNSDSFCKQFNSFCTNISDTSIQNRQLYKFDHHENISSTPSNVLTTNVDNNYTGSFDIDSQSCASLTEKICHWSDKIIKSAGLPDINSDKSTPVNKCHSLIKAWENLSEANTTNGWPEKVNFSLETKLLQGESKNLAANKVCEKDHIHDISSSKYFSPSSSDSDINICSKYTDETIDGSFLENKSITNDIEPVFATGNWIKIPSLRSSMSDDIQEVTNFRQSLENLLLSEEDDVFEKDNLKMSVSSDALEIDALDGDVHGWIEGLRAKLEEVLGLEMFMEAYRCLECAFEKNDPNLKQALSHVRKMIGPIHEQMADDILQLIVTESVHLN